MLAVRRTLKAAPDAEMWLRCLVQWLEPNNAYEIRSNSEQYSLIVASVNLLSYLEC